MLQMQGITLIRPQAWALHTWSQALISTLLNLQVHIYLYLTAILLCCISFPCEAITVSGYPQQALITLTCCGAA